MTASVQWLFLDLNSYFASVEQQAEPKLRGKPIAVVPVMSDSSCAIAASYEAKRFGIKTGTRIFEAKRLCPDLICVPARHDVYVETHHRILAEVDRHIPVTRVHSIDEMACRLMGSEMLVDNARDIARRVKNGIRDRVGECLTSSVGLAPNVFLAKVGSDMQKPDGLTVLTREMLPGPLLGLRLSDLTGIGVNMARRLSRAGILSVADFWNLEPKEARRVWGGVGGEMFWYALRGHDLPHRETMRRTVGHSRVLAPALRPPDQARLVARRLMTKAAARLRRMNYVASGVALGARLEAPARDGSLRWGGETRVPACQDTRTLLAAVDTLWRDFERAYRGARLKKVSVTLFRLDPADAVTPDLFDGDPVRRAGEAARYARLAAAIDRLNTRYGRDTVSYGPLPGDELDFAGVKIAFTRIPDMAEFEE
jgi:DNA polymerase-4